MKTVSVPVIGEMMSKINAEREYLALRDEIEQISKMLNGFVKSLTDTDTDTKKDKER